MENNKKSGVEYFNEGFSCAESSLLAIAEKTGRKCQCVPQVASGFGAGLGRHGEVCGAISGALMAIGLVFGRKDPIDTEGKEKMYALSGKLLQSFQDKFGKIRCLELTGCDMLTEEGRKKAKDTNIHGNICTGLVDFACNEAIKIIRENK